MFIHLYEDFAFQVIEKKLEKKTSLNPYRDFLYLNTTLITTFIVLKLKKKTQLSENFILIVIVILKPVKSSSYVIDLLWSVINLFALCFKKFGEKEKLTEKIETMNLGLNSIAPKHLDPFRFSFTYLAPETSPKELGYSPIYL